MNDIKAQKGRQTQTWLLMELNHARMQQHPYQRHHAQAYKQLADEYKPKRKGGNHAHRGESSRHPGRYHR